MKLNGLNIFNRKESYEARLEKRAKVQEKLDAFAESANAEITAKHNDKISLMWEAYLPPDKISFDYKNWVEDGKSKKRSNEWIIAKHEGKNEQGLRWERTKGYMPKRFETTKRFIKRVTTDWMTFVKDKGPV